MRSHEVVRGKSPPFHSGWDEWIAENLARGVSRSKLADRLLLRGFEYSFVHERLDQIEQSPLLNCIRVALDREQKLSELLNTLGRLQALGQNDLRIEELNNPEPEAFYRDFVYRNRPVVCRELVAHWPALDRWGPDYFLATLGDIDIEISDRRTSDPRFEDNFRSHVTPTTLRTFVERLKNGGKTNEFYLCAKHNLLTRAGSEDLLEDFDYPAHLLDESVPKARASIWFGPAGTWTPFHHDASNILFCQVKGTKILRLVSPTYLPRVYNDRKCFSNVDPRDIDEDRFPLMRNVPVLSVRVSSGDALFLPVGWWHCVEALDMSISISLGNFKLPCEANVWKWRD